MTNVALPSQINHLSLCAGAAGIALGLRIALGHQVRTVCYVERESYAAATIVARMESAALDDAPVWDDVATFDGSAWRGVVDLVTAGFPCQPWSVAGKRADQEDERAIWPSIARVIEEAEPAIVFLENVPGILVRGGIDKVVADLEALGYQVQRPLLLAASDVGASQGRERVYILAVRIGVGRGRAHTQQRRIFAPERSSESLAIGNSGRGKRKRAEHQRSDAGTNGRHNVGGIGFVDRNYGEVADPQRAIGGSADIGQAKAPPLRGETGFTYLNA